MKRIPYLRILVVEDDPDFRSALVDSLEAAGYEVFQSARGEEAIELARNVAFDLVVTDVRMPGMDGLDTLAQLKEKQPAIKSLVISGYSSQVQAIRAAQLGVGFYLQKPFELSELLIQINKVAAQRRWERQIQQRELDWKRTTLAALTAWARALDPKILRAADFARRLAQRCVDSFSLEMTVEIVALVTSARIGGAVFEQPYLEPETFELVEVACETLQNEALSNPDLLALPLVAQISVVAVSREYAIGFEMMAGACDSNIQSALSEEPNPPLGSDSTNSLLALGLALEGSKDWPQARKIFAEVAGRQLSQTAVQGQLGLCRCERALEGDNLLEACEKLLEIAALLGPETQFNAHLEAGLLLLDRFRPQADHHFRQAHSGFRTLHDGLGEEKALLCLALLGSECSSVDYQPGLGALDWAVSVAPYLLAMVLRWPRRVPVLFLKRLLNECQASLSACSIESSSLDYIRSVLGEDFPGSTLSGAADLARNTPGLRILCLGLMQVFWGPKLLSDSHWKHRKVLYLLGYLAKNWRSGVLEERLLEDFWPGDIDRARRSLNQATWQLRHYLRKEDSKFDPLERQQGTLALTRDGSFWNDVRAFEEYLEKGFQAQRYGDEQACQLHLRTAIEFYKGPFLDGCYMDWALEARDQLERRYSEALRWLAGHARNQGAFSDSLEFAQKLLDLDPVDESGAILAMEAWVALGKSEKSIALFDKFVKKLNTELQLEPSDEILRVHQLVRQRVESGYR